MQLIYHDYYSGCTSSETCSFGATSACLYGSPIQLFSCTARIFVRLTVHHLEKLSQTINLMTAAIPPSCWEVVESVAGMDWRWSKKTTLKNVKSSTMFRYTGCLLAFIWHLVYLCAVTTYVWVSCSHDDTIFPNSERSLCIKVEPASVDEDQCALSLLNFHLSTSYGARTDGMLWLYCTDQKSNHDGPFCLLHPGK